MNKPSFKQVLNLTLIVLLLIFAAQNIDKVNVRFLPWSFDISLIILIVSIFLIGLVTGHLFLGQKKEKPCADNDALLKQDETIREDGNLYK